MKTVASALGPRDTYRVDKATREVLPRVLPATWTVSERYLNCVVYKRMDRLMVMAEVELIDGELWLHTSSSRPDRIPSWEDLREVKDVIIGRDRKAIQILPRESEYVNINPRVLHMYAALDRDPMPDFRMVDADGKVGI